MRRIRQLGSGSKPSRPGVGRGSLRLTDSLSCGSMRGMSLLTLEVEIADGKVTPAEPGLLPAHGRGLLTILPERTAVRNPLAPHPVLSQGRILADATEPLSAEDWPESQR